MSKLKTESSDNPMRYYLAMPELAIVQRKVAQLPWSSKLLESDYATAKCHG
jgi:hypothetical protein